MEDPIKDISVDISYYQTETPKSREKLRKPGVCTSCGQAIDAKDIDTTIVWEDGSGLCLKCLEYLRSD